MMDKDLVRDQDPGDEDQSLENPLGIAREPVAADSAVRASSDPDEVRQRRRRVSENLNSRTTDGLGDLEGDPLGATSIDMGGGGDGNDIKQSR